MAKRLEIVCPKCDLLLEVENMKVGLLSKNNTGFVLNTQCFECNSNYRFTFKLEKIQEIK